MAVNVVVVLHTEGDGFVWEILQRRPCSQASPCGRSSTKPWEKRIASPSGQRGNDLPSSPLVSRAACIVTDEDVSDAAEWGGAHGVRSQPQSSRHEQSPQKSTSFLRSSARARCSMTLALF